MEKIGIVTLNGYVNYGNRLQNYALQEAIEMLGFECETIINKTLVGNNLTKKEKIAEFLSKSVKDKYRIVYTKLNNKRYEEINVKRTKIFKDFSMKYINETKFSIELGRIPKSLHEEYKYFVAGSDQVWNPNYPEVSEVNFLTFAPENKRIAYAPSFGVSNIPKKYEEKYRTWISGINCISVREDAGADIIKNLTERDSSVVIDPTMLLTKEKWLTIARAGENKPQNKYILTYFLGGIPKEYYKKIINISKKYDLEIINLADNKDKKHYVTGPSEFIDYINSASLFITDSFHGCVFSLLLETPFIVCNRVTGLKSNSIGSRIDTFLNKFKLESRRIDKINDSILFDCNYNEANKILEIERQKSWEYLKKSLK